LEIIAAGEPCGYFDVMVRTLQNAGIGAKQLPIVEYDRQRGHIPKPHPRGNEVYVLVPVERLEEALKILLATVARKFAIGNKVKLVGMPPVLFGPGVEDEIGTKKVLRRMVGKTYTVRGYDQYGNVELRPTRTDTVWIEPTFLRLRVRKTHKRKPNEA
jgi:hypothetical protein